MRRCFSLHNEKPGAGAGFSRSDRMVRQRSLIVHSLFDCVFDPAEGVLQFAGGLLRLAFGFELGIAGNFARDFLHFAFGLLDRAFDAIFVHVFLSMFVVSIMTTTGAIERWFRRISLG
jgi:hypothetical protein